MSLQPGTRLGPYEVVSKIGAGGMGEVWLADELRLGRKVALKLLPADLTRDPGRILLFEQEARAASALNHPNVCTIHALDQTSDGQHYIAMEFVEGPTLRQRLTASRLSVPEVLAIGVQVSAALSVAHAAGIVHRDIKPENVMLRPDGVIKVLDFGLAKLAPVTRGGGDQTQTRMNTDMGTVVGTVAYMSPEQARGQPVDARTDIWSLGVMLYEMVAQRSPFAGPTVSDMLAAILQNEPLSLEQLAPEAPSELHRIVRKALRKDREHRYQGIKDLLVDLQSLRDGLMVPSTTGTASEIAVPRTPTLHMQFGLRRPGWLLLMGALAAMVSLWAYLHAARPSGPPALPSSVPFTTFLGQEQAPTFSPDGSQIAFAWSPEGLADQFDLYVKVMGSETTLRLTTHPATFISPSWSPDGRQIAFTRRGGDRSGIFVVPSLGGAERKLADAAFSYFLEMVLSWSPDGTLLAYQKETGDSKGRGIGLLNLATLETRLLGHPAGHCAWSMVPTFAPDGRSLAVACAVTFDVTDLCIMPVSGGTGPCVARVEGEFTGMTWAADGKSIVFATNGNLWRVPVAGGVVQKLLAGRDAAAPTISRDGRRLAFEQSVVNVNLWQVRLAATTRPDGTPLKLISSSRMQRSAAFSPDDRRVAFESNRSGTTEIWVSDADGSNASALTAFGGPLTGSPDWSPDGRYIALDSRAGGHSGLYVVGAEGGPVRRIETGRVDSSVPLWSPDGRWFYFASPVAGRDEIFRVPVQGGTASAVTHAGGYWPRMSRDGARIYYFNAGAIWWVPTAGGRETRLAGMPRLDPEFNSSWAVAILGVYFINPKAPAGIDFFDFASERVVRVVDLSGKPEEYANVSLSPDGRRLLYAQRDGFVADIMLIDHLQ